MIIKRFTGEGIARALLLDLTDKEKDEYIKNKKSKHRIISDDPLPRLWRRIKPGRLFYIRFADGHGVILSGDNKEDACIQAVPLIAEGKHHCRDPIFNKSCDECRSVFNELAERLNNSTVTWIGWCHPDYTATAFLT